MLTSHGRVGSAQFLDSLIHKALMPPIPVIGVKEEELLRKNGVNYSDQIRLAVGMSSTAAISA
jgi:hypothetical protein